MIIIKKIILITIIIINEYETENDVWNYNK